MWIKNCWQVAAFSNEVRNAILTRKFLNIGTILYRTQDGQVVAMEDRCPHRLTPLSKGSVQGDNIQCGYHGLCFDRQGACVVVPGQENIPSKARVRVFPSVEKFNLVWIWLGDPALADEALMPDPYWLDDAGWVPSEGYHHVNANYQLINDNLLDLSHETYVHPHTIGNRAVAESPLAVTVPEGRQVRAFREMTDCEPPPFYVAAAGSTGRIDRWHTTVYTPPGYHAIESGSCPAGMDKSQAAREGRMPERRNLNFITPETESSSHYFWASCRNYSLDDQELTGFIREQIRFTFDQDKEILEAQQAMVGHAVDGAFPVALRADAGAIQGRRLLQAMIEQEQKSGATPDTPYRHPVSQDAA
ncbi:aromatic ring-hydroxylating dioxygenase subunit alpha [Pusillimonas sp.]|uniref:aromatic ring-hydroxylating dioxygenase subunit alpha n=1 Tax=Pusillimonas sp. TaxID=3040095 RepID=UPI0029A2A31E|nr:aromatic ring-hydroxylating dioxygenase subunit alpha [Pusillimonas sp.]MDX3894015.1 aromatic ring-hydroxylating dioxygenase subunit alpha [Pusillimonas sp.]